LRRFLSVALAGALIATTAIFLFKARQKPAVITFATADKILVEKSARRLTLFSSGRKLREYRVALGFSPVGPKQREGDGRTPEGNYKIDFHKFDSVFHRALHISYPDTADAGRAAEAGVAPDSNVETFAAVRMEVNSWRWQGVPFYIRAGKCLPVTATEVLIRLRQPPPLYPSDSLTQNYVRLRLVPDRTIALGIMVLTPGQETAGQPAEMVACTEPGAGEEDAYERLLVDAMAGDQTLFAREDHVEEAWRIVDPVVKPASPVSEYEPGTWGPTEVAQKVAPPGGWHDPVGTTLPAREEVLRAA
jgi:hypothetical protein